mmetsp:Transcript_636/g.2490  ORF Transcript_636/g.2490 Transcript_636/m.2490 type:complete len:190 (-) Transcript_636:86-655(-)
MMMQTMSVGAVALGARGRAGRARGGARLTSRNEAPLGARGWMREGRRGGGSVGGGSVRGMEMMRVRARRGAVVTRAESGDREGRGKGKGFVGGILLGGAVFGALGFLFAPQLSKTLLGGKRAVNKMLDEENEDELELTRQNLNEKIAALNAAIDNFSKEAEGGLEKNMNKLNEELNSLESSQKREVSEA